MTQICRSCNVLYFWGSRVRRRSWCVIRETVARPWRAVTRSSPVSVQFCRNSLSDSSLSFHTGVWQGSPQGPLDAWHAVRYGVLRA